MTTATVIIEGALRSIGMLKKGTTTDADELADGLELLNQMLGLWSVQTLIVPYRTNETLTLPSSAASYTLGSTGDIVTARPIEIKNITYKVGNTPYPLRSQSLEMLRAYNTSLGGVPDYYMYEATYPNGTLYFNYKPGSGNTIEVDSIKALTTFTNVTTNVSFPEGFDFALRFNLAKYIASEYGKAIPPAVAEGAATGMDILKSYSASVRESFARVDQALSNYNGHYKVLQDQ